MLGLYGFPRRTVGTSRVGARVVGFSIMACHRGLREPVGRGAGLSLSRSSVGAYICMLGSYGFPRRTVGTSRVGVRVAGFSMVICYRG